MLPVEPDSPGAPLVSAGAEPVTLPLPLAPLVVSDVAPDVPAAPVLTVPVEEFPWVPAPVLEVVEPPGGLAVAVF